MSLKYSDSTISKAVKHASFTTTQQYIKYAETHQQRAYDVYLPGSLKVKAG